MIRSLFTSLFYLFYFTYAGILRCQLSFLSQEEKQKFLIEIKKHIYTFSADRMHGREAGTKGEKKASKYIIRTLKQLHIQPLLDTYEDRFTIPSLPSVKKAVLIVDKTTFTYPNDFGIYQLLQDDNGLLAFKQLSYQSVDTISFTGSTFAKLEIDPKLGKKHWEDSLSFLMIEKLKQKFAYSTGNTLLLASNRPMSLPSKIIPRYYSHQNILFVRSKKLEKYLTNSRFPIKYGISVHFSSDTTSVSRNILGWIDNQAPTTILLSAHYDHLGYGLSNSRNIGKPMVHNGADDNASGVAFVLALAKYIISHPQLFNNHNYIFAFWSAEEKGLLGSKHFVNKYPDILNKTIAALNFDMVGRFDSTQRPLYILGTGSSPIWDSLFYVSFGEKNYIKKVPGSIRGSDQYSFYIKQIPVLFFFTGMHQDYHTHDDDPEKIYYDGMIKILEITLNLLAELNKIKYLPFSNVPEENTISHGRTKHSLGIVPDLSWQGKGVRIDGIVSGKIAEKIGLQPGDIIVRINEIDIENIYQYMQVLNKLTSDKEHLIFILRQENKLSFPFQLN
ncbi:MAG: M28 family peptidase [Bacteroidales bacterium]|nr:M28 family peptidase [Bacteroidales bacterium]